MSVKLEKLIISNFRSIGAEPVSVELDDIVILVGGNNFGKSTILKAYQAAVNSEKISKEDFHNKITNDPNSYPVIELHMICDGDDRPGVSFRDILEPSLGQNSPVRVKERFIWSEPGKAPRRLGFRTDLGRYPNTDSDDAPHQPWATDNASRKKRPKAHLIGTFDNPDQQSDSIKNILVDVLLEQKIRSFTPSEQVIPYSSLYEQFNSLKEEFVSSTKNALDEIADDISAYVSKIVPDHKLDISLQCDNVADSNIKLFDCNELQVSFGKENQMFPVSNHGSGARRTLLWAVLKKIAELGYESSDKGKYKALGDIKAHLLLLDEPELSLHPYACREARDMLYDIAEKNENWQVMITTHSPSFIDLTRQHTKIIRVENENNNIIATTIFKPNDVSFSADETESLKLLNLLNPDTMEFFFGGKVLLVEGDTEYSAFGKIIKDAKNNGEDDFNDLLIVRCGGKVQVAMFMKILNHFNKKYCVLHDIDAKQILKNRWIKNEQGVKEKTLRIEANPAWSNNEKINAEMTEFSDVYASVINFETAYFDHGIDSGKPENAINMLKNTDVYEVVKSLLLGIVNADENLLPENTIRWTEVSQISDRFDSYAQSNPEVIPTAP
ncbi:TPA: ATP-dependent nuclease [Citrobacter freundii]|uniref:ATP-dependent nuclease n=1 Tax=Citrobacter TaxID=544 RepID=UPI001904997D|nr:MULTISPECIES: AAA family ATPase [Citrobacter]MBJ9201431.1 AAA family ATPase [Citrobacter freundii]MDM3144190.1 AAA family ATPase [Citrobacter sp. Cf124]